MQRGTGEGGVRTDALPFLEDRELLAFIAMGDPEALGVMYDRHIASVWRMALMTCRDETAARRVVHDAFLELWRRPYANGSQQPVVRLLARVREACAA